MSDTESALGAGPSNQQVEEWITLDDLKWLVKLIEEHKKSHTRDFNSLTILQHVDTQKTISIITNEECPIFISQNISSEMNEFAI